MLLFYHGTAHATPLLWTAPWSITPHLQTVLPLPPVSYRVWLSLIKLMPPICLIFSMMQCPEWDWDTSLLQNFGNILILKTSHNSYLSWLGSHSSIFCLKMSLHLLFQELKAASVQSWAFTCITIQHAVKFSFFLMFTEVKSMSLTPTYSTLWRNDGTDQHAFFCVTVMVALARQVLSTQNNNASTWLQTSLSPAMHSQQAESTLIFWKCHTLNWSKN